MFDSFKYTKPPSSSYNTFGSRAAATQDKYGGPAMAQGLQDLQELLKGKGRVDPRLLAALQAQNARSTQQQQDASRANTGRSGFGNSGLGAALQASIGAAGANRAANLNYQDIADSYGRRQENLGLLNQLVIQPSLGYGQLGNEWGLGQQQQKNNQKAGWLGFSSSLFGAAGKAAGG